MLHIFFGEDEFSCYEELQKLENRYRSDPALGDLNRSVLDGRTISLAELKHHVDAVPFLAERRLVIVEGLVTRLDGKPPSRERMAESEQTAEERGQESNAEFLNALFACLSELPETTDLVLLDAGLRSKESRGRIVQWAKRQGERAVVREFPKKSPQELQNWIKTRVKAAGGAIEEQAVSALIQTVGDDLRVLAQEIEKLLLYVDESRAITPEDVRRLVPHSKEANIFHIVDAIGERQWSKAIAELRHILDEGMHPLQVFAMIHRQYSLIVRARALARERLSPEELARRLGVHEYVAKKVQAQAARYTDWQLRDIYEHLLETDLAIKTGQLEASLALEMFIAGREARHHARQAPSKMSLASC